VSAVGTGASDDRPLEESEPGWSLTANGLVVAAACSASAGLGGSSWKAHARNGSEASWLSNQPRPYRAPEPSLRVALEACLRAGALAAPRLWARAEGLRRGLGARSPCGAARLTARCYPFELAFVSGEVNPRLTAEVGPEGLTPKQRPAAAWAWSFGTRQRAQPGPARLPGDLLGLQALGSLQFGALLGWRERQGRILPKFYLEVPRGCPAGAACVRAEFGARPLLVGREAQLVLLGLEPRSGIREHYFEAPELEPWQLERLLGRLDLSSAAPGLFAALEALCQRSCERRMPWGNVGFSLSQQRRVLTIFGPARTLFGSDATSRRRLLAMGAWLGQDLSTYAAASAPLADGEIKQRCHGLVGLVVSPECLRLWIGLRPPPVPADGPPAPTRPATFSSSGPGAPERLARGVLLEPITPTRPRQSAPVVIQAAIPSTTAP
jgi:hypothetical protein